MISSATRAWSFGALCALFVALLWGPVQEWVRLSLDDPRYSHVILIPVISAYFLVRERRKIFTGASFSPRLGVVLLAVIAAAYGLERRLLVPSSQYALSAVTFTMCLAVASAFVFCWGTQALRAARFSWLLLLLLVPVPSAWMDWIIGILQQASAQVTYAFFSLMGTPMFRRGVTFELPGVGITVAAECSSIHSTWALFITGLLVGHLALRSMWAKTLLSLVTVPIAVLTNAIRITTLWLLGTKVDMGFLDGKLHHRGGIVFSLISVAVLLLLLALLRSMERQASAYGRGSPVMAGAKAGGQ